ncbi:MAG: hypothetical protein IEMM0001_0848 [bacterium]|nr:MAG: hypothetical protein IEMM0001_0848 [bacterium]
MKRRLRTGELMIDLTGIQTWRCNNGVNLVPFYGLEALGYEKVK